MENKDVDPQGSPKPEGSPKLSEASPLITEEQKTAAIGRRDMLLKLAAEISELSLEPLEVTSTTPTDGATPDLTPEETAVQVPSSNSEEDKSGASTDGEQTEAPETDVGETSEQPPTNASEIIESNATQDSATESAMRPRRPPLFDRTMWLLLWEIILLAVPVSMAYYAIKYVRGCDDGEMLSLLLIIVAFITFLTLVARILVNAYKKLDRYDENNPFPEPILVAADGLSGFLFIAEMIYFFTIDKEHCNEDFYVYVFFVNNVAIGVIALALFLKCRQHFRSSCGIACLEQE